MLNKTVMRKTLAIITLVIILFSTFAAIFPLLGHAETVGTLNCVLEEHAHEQACWSFFF